METLRASSSSFSSSHLTTTTTSSPLLRPQLPKTTLTLPFPPKPNSSPSLQFFSTKPKFKNFVAISPTISADQEDEIDDQGEKFDWFSQWYAVMPVCELDKRIPCGKKIMGLDVVVWWDKNENAWKVFDDSCPHRLAPLSEGRIDQWGRLQCVYHGWCFGGSGDCKFIPQAPPDGPPVNTFKKACVAVYPSTVQNGIIWFWPNTDPQYKDILTTKKPPYIPELDDPSFTHSIFNREISYGYEFLTENLMDPAHVPYAHYGIMRTQQPKNSVKADREGGRPLDIVVQKVEKNGFTAKQGAGTWKFIAPCLFYGSAVIGGAPGTGSTSSERKTEGQSSQTPQKRVLLIFICIPVTPGNSRLIFASPQKLCGLG